MADVLLPDWPAPPGVRAFTTTRALGNLATHVGDDPQAVAARRTGLRSLLPSEPLWLDQVHGRECVAAESARPGVAADASFATTPGRVCAILTADCLPVLICDSGGRAVAAIHAGWRGLAAGVIENAIDGMAPPDGDWLAWLGPAIGPQRYEVGADVRGAMMQALPECAAMFGAVGEGKWLCDLYGIARLQLAKAGVTRVWGGDHCTWTERETFYSHRRGGQAGRMATLIWIEGGP